MYAIDVHRLSRCCARHAHRYDRGRCARCVPRWTCCGPTSPVLGQTLEEARSLRAATRPSDQGWPHWPTAARTRGGAGADGMRFTTTVSGTGWPGSRWVSWPANLNSGAHRDRTSVRSGRGVRRGGGPACSGTAAGLVMALATNSANRHRRRAACVAGAAQRIDLADPLMAARAAGSIQPSMPMDRTGRRSRAGATGTRGAARVRGGYPQLRAALSDLSRSGRRRGPWRRPNCG